MALADAKPFAVAAYPLGEASGDALDAVGSLDLTENGTIGSASGLMHNARDFDSSDTDYFEIASNSTFAAGGGGSFMFTLWLNFESLESFANIFGKWSSESGNEYLLYLDSSARLHWIVRNTLGAETDRTATNAGSLSTNTWYLVCVWYDNAGSGEIGISVHGAADSTPNVSAHSAGVNSSTTAFRLGARVGGTRYDGLMEEVVLLHDYLLDATERDELWNSGAGVPFEDWGGGGGGTPVFNAVWCINTNKFQGIGRIP